MTLESLKEDYKKTFTEPRLSGKFLSEKYQKEFFEKIDSTSNLDEFVSVLDSINGGFPMRNPERHILLRILNWNSEPAVDENGNRGTNN